MHHPRSMRHDNTIFLRPVAFARDGKSRHRYPGGHQRRKALRRICLVQLEKIRRDSRAPKTVQADLSNYMTTVNGGVSSCACRSLACMSKSLRFAGKTCHSLTDGSNIVDLSSREPSESRDKGQSLPVRRCASSNGLTFWNEKLTLLPNGLALTASTTPPSAEARLGSGHAESISCNPPYTAAQEPDGTLGRTRSTGFLPLRASSSFIPATQQKGKQMPTMISKSIQARLHTPSLSGFEGACCKSSALQIFTRHCCFAKA